MVFGFAALANNRTASEVSFEQAVKVVTMCVVHNRSQNIRS